MTMAAAVVGLSVLGGLEQRSNDLFNAEQARQDQQNLLLEGKTNLFLSKRSEARRVQSIRAAFGASGVRLAGTPAAILADQISTDVMNNSIQTYENQLAAFHQGRIARGFHRKASQDVIHALIGGTAQALPLMKMK